VLKLGEGDKIRTEVEVLSEAAREEEIARMLSGAQVTAEARAAARALMHA
jgi:DNA repair protein RecN (Recombination protein N)